MKKTFLPIAFVIILLLVGCGDDSFNIEHPAIAVSFIEETDDGLGLKLEVTNLYTFDSREVEFSIFATSKTRDSFTGLEYNHSNTSADDRSFVVYNSSITVPADSLIEVIVPYSSLLDDSNTEYSDFLSSAAPELYYGAMADPDVKMTDRDPLVKNYELSYVSVDGFTWADDYELNETYTNATNITFRSVLNSSVYFQDSFSLSFPTDVDWIAFSAGSTDTYTINTVDHDRWVVDPTYFPEVDTVIYLYDESLNELATNDNKTGSLLSSLSYGLTSGDNYFVKVTGKTNNDIGHYFLEIESDL